MHIALNNIGTRNSNSKNIASGIQVILVTLRVTYFLEDSLHILRILPFCSYLERMMELAFLQTSISPRNDAYTGSRPLHVFPSQSDVALYGLFGILAQTCFQNMAIYILCLPYSIHLFVPMIYGLGAPYAPNVPGVLIHLLQSIINCLFQS